MKIKFFLLVVPIMARSQYDADGIAYDSIQETSARSMITSTTILSTTIVVPTIEDNDIKNVNGTVVKRTMKKGIEFQESILF